MVAKLKPDVLFNTNPFLEAMNKERLNHKGYCDKIALSINDKKYNVNSKCTLQFSYQSVWASPTAGDSQ